MIYLLCITIALWGVFRGIDEGIDMFTDGNKVHWWYRHYHWFPNLRDVCGLLVGALAVIVGRDLIQRSSVFLLLGSLILMWQLFENAYSYTHIKRFIPDHENLLGLSLYVWDTDVLSVHIARWTAFATLFGIGLHLALR